MSSPPHDPALPQLPVALDGAAMVELLNAALRDRDAGRLTVTGCLPSYVRYKPQTSCLLQYRLWLRDNDDGTTRETTGFVELYADGRATQLWARPSFQALVKRAARHHPDPPMLRAALLPSLRAVAQFFPVDFGLRSLVRATKPRALRRDLGEALPDWAGRPAKAQAEVVRYKPSRKALLRCRWEAGPTESAYIKLFTDDRGAQLHQAVETLSRYGVATPRILAYLPRQRLIVHEAAPGTQLAALRGTDLFVDWMSGVAETLGRFQAIHISGLPVYPLAAEATTVRQAAVGLSTLLPHLAPRLTSLSDKVAAALAQLPDAYTTVHGDFYDDQTIISVDGVTILDLDEIRLGHPLIDVGNLNAHLLVAEDRGVVSTAGARAAFAGEYFRQRPDDERDLPVFEAAALLKLAVGPFRRLEANWPATIERTVALAEQRFAAARKRRSVAVGDGQSRRS